MKTTRPARSNITSPISIVDPLSRAFPTEPQTWKSSDTSRILAEVSLTLRDKKRYSLYQVAVQSAEADAQFLAETYRSIRGKQAERLAEDFCGTFALCCEWIRLDAGRTAIGVDLDPNPMAYGLRYNASGLGIGQRARLSLKISNVLAKDLARADLICALNFSYYVFRDRATLLAYFRNVRRRLRPDGVFVVDAFGGANTQCGYTQKKKLSGFTYTWEQRRFDPFTNQANFAIHFAEKGSRPMRNAFVYDWRMWTIPEIREVMQAAGFRETIVYWEGTQSNGEGNGIFTRRSKGEECDVWIAYIAGVL